MVHLIKGWWGAGADHEHCCPSTESVLGHIVDPKEARACGVGPGLEGELAESPDRWKERLQEKHRLTPVVYPEQQCRLLSLNTGKAQGRWLGEAVGWFRVRA